MRLIGLAGLPGPSHHDVEAATLGRVAASNSATHYPIAAQGSVLVGLAEFLEVLGQGLDSSFESANAGTSTTCAGVISRNTRSQIRGQDFSFVHVVRTTYSKNSRTSAGSIPIGCIAVASNATIHGGGRTEPGASRTTGLSGGGGSGGVEGPRHGVSGFGGGGGSNVSAAGDPRAGEGSGTSRDGAGTALRTAGAGVCCGASRVAEVHAPSASSTPHANAGSARDASPLPGRRRRSSPMRSQDNGSDR